MEMLKKVKKHDNLLEETSNRIKEIDKKIHPEHSIVIDKKEGPEGREKSDIVIEEHREEHKSEVSEPVVIEKRGAEDTSENQPEVATIYPLRCSVNQKNVLKIYPVVFFHAKLPNKQICFYWPWSKNWFLLAKIDIFQFGFFPSICAFTVRNMVENVGVIHFFLASIFI